MTDKAFSLDLRILLMDENPLLRRNLKSKFKSSGYTNIFFAENLRRALHILNNNQIHLIISDIGTTQSTGLQLLHKIRETPVSKNIPFLMIMRKPDSDIIKATLEAGANGYLTKPVSFNILEQEMSRVLENA